jgi:GNAT superfamily N-acetyltransferase
MAATRSRSDGWRGNMYRMAVHPDYQRRGVAGRFVEFAREWLRSIGCTRHRPRRGRHAYATGFWESAGYTHDTAMRRYHFNIGKSEA